MRLAIIPLLVLMILAVSAFAPGCGEGDTGDGDVDGDVSPDGDSVGDGDMADGDDPDGDPGPDGDDPDGDTSGDNSGRVWGTLGETAIDQKCSFSGSWYNSTYIAGNMATIACSEDDLGQEGFQFSLSFNNYTWVAADYSYDKSTIYSGSSLVLGLNSRILPGDTMLTIGASSNLEVFSLTGTFDVDSGHCTATLYGLWGEPDNRFQESGELNAEFEVVFPMP